MKPSGVAAAKWGSGGFLARGSGGRGVVIIFLIFSGLSYVCFGGCSLGGMFVQTGLQVRAIRAAK